MNKPQKTETRLHEQTGLKDKRRNLNYRNYITTNLDRDLFLLRAKLIQRQMVRSMRRLAFLYKGGSSA